MENEKTMTREQVLDHLLNAEKNPVVRDGGKVTEGKVGHQGDIYLHRVPDDTPHGKLLGTKKLAIGEGEGSNHYAEGIDVEVYETTIDMTKILDKADPEFISEMTGPTIVAKSPFKQTHPVHADFTYDPGTYVVSYQLDMKTRRRVAD